MKGFTASLQHIASGKLFSLVSDAADSTQTKVSHPSLSPGKYELTVTNENWCFSDQPVSTSTVPVEIPVDENVVGEPVTVEQKAFLMKIKTDYTTKINILHGEDSSEETVVSGLNKFCIPNPGRYEIQPQGCHIFAKPEYGFDSKNPAVIELTAEYHEQVRRYINV